MGFDPRAASSLEWVPCTITAEASDGGVYDPTSDTVQMAFTLNSADPSGGDWNTASWRTLTSGSRDVYQALCLVGPGGTIALTAGNYSVWVKVTDSPEVPVIKVNGFLSVL